jgi:hypothetical protein
MPEESALIHMSQAWQINQPRRLGQLDYPVGCFHAPQYTLIFMTTQYDFFFFKLLTDYEDIHFPQIC